MHAQVEELLRDLITSPKYRNGEYMPTEGELANRLGVSRNTVRQATNKLEYEGLLIRKKGLGTKVAPTQVMSTSLSNWHSFTKEMKGRGIDVVNLKVECTTVKADAKLAGFFNISPGTPLKRLSKIKGVGKAPIVFFDSYFYPRIELMKTISANRYMNCWRKNTASWSTVRARTSVPGKPATSPKN